MPPGSLHSSIQHAILAAIGPVQLKWPGLSPAMWAKLQDDPAEADRIEFVGDAVVRLVLSLEVYKRYPSEGPGLYTKLVQALYSNLTFYSLFEKPIPTGTRQQIIYDERDGQKTEFVTTFTWVDGATVKPVGDKFESIVGAFYLEYGLEELQKWLIRLFDPLIKAAFREFKRCETLGLYREEGVYKRPHEIGGRANPDSPRKRPRLAKERQPYIVKYGHAKKQASWWQRLASAAGQTLGGGAFQDYQFSFRAPGPSHEPNHGPSPSNAGIDRPTQTSASVTTTLETSARPSYASIVQAGRPSASPARTFAPLPRRAAHATPAIHGDPPIRVPKATGPIVIDLTLDDDDALSASTIHAAAPQHGLQSHGVAITQQSSYRLVQPFSYNATWMARDVPAIDGLTSRPSDVLEVEETSEHADASVMDISFGYNDYLRLPAEPDTSFHQVSVPPIAPAIDDGLTSPPTCAEDEDDQEMVEVEQLLDWIAELGPAVDRVEPTLSMNRDDRKREMAVLHDGNQTKPSLGRVPRRSAVSIPLQGTYAAKAKAQLFTFRSFMPTFASGSPRSSPALSKPSSTVEPLLLEPAGRPQVCKGIAKGASHQCTTNDENEPNDASDGSINARGKRAVPRSTPKAPRPARGVLLATDSALRGRYQPYSKPPQRRHEPLWPTQSRQPCDDDRGGNSSYGPACSRNGRYEPGRRR